MVSPQIKIKQLVFVSVFIKAFLAFVPKWGCWGQKKPDLLTYSTYFNRVFKREACFQVLKKVNRRSKKDGSTPERFPFSQWWVSSHLRGIKVIKPLKEKFPLSATSFVAKWKGPKADTRLFLFFVSLFYFSPFYFFTAQCGCLDSRMKFTVLPTWPLDGSWTLLSNPNDRWQPFRDLKKTKIR